MWQAESFDPDSIERELQWAAGLGYNSVRVFLQFMVWESRPGGPEGAPGDLFEVG